MITETKQQNVFANNFNSTRFGFKRYPSINLIEKEHYWDLEFNDSDSGWVYLMKVQGANRYKIGCSKNSEARLKSLKTAQSPFDIQIVYKFRCFNMRWFEKSLHTYYSEYNARGEWFDIPDSEYERDTLQSIFSLNYEGCPTCFEYVVEKVGEIIENWIKLNISKITNDELPEIVLSLIEHTSYLIAQTFDPSRYSWANIGDIDTIFMMLRDSISVLYTLFLEVWLKQNKDAGYDPRLLPVSFNHAESAIIMWLGYLRGKMSEVY